VATEPAQTPIVPPAERTIGQLVADTLRFYGQRFWACLALGIGPAVLTAAAGEAPRQAQLAVLFTGWPLLMTVSYVAACFLLFDSPFRWARAATAALVGVLVMVPAALLITLFLLPAVLWLGLFGLAVPAVVVEGGGVRASIRRGIALGRTDYAHAAGTIATLVMLVALTQLALFLLLHGLSQQAVLGAAFMASMVVSPVIFIGSAQLYSDQTARARVKSAGN
jgi:hypothetical protein